MRRTILFSAILTTSVVLFFSTARTLAQTVTATSTNATCVGSCDGAIDVKVSGGVAPYTFAWSNGGTSIGTTTWKDTNNVAIADPTVIDFQIKLCPGTYTVTVTDNGGSTKTSVSTISVAPANPLVVQSDPSNVLCVSTCTGSIKVNVTGGNAPYTYSWSGSAVTGNTRNGLCAGTYSVTVTDKAGCDSILSYVVGPNPAVTATGGSVCSGGSVVLSASGASSYSWSGGPATPTYSVSPGTTTTYTVTGTNSGCPSTTATATVTINPAASVSASGVDALCNGTSTGSVTATPGTGTGPFTYLWAAGGATGQTATGQPAGTYTVTLTDSKGCTATSSVTISEPTKLTASLAQTQPACGTNGGTATVTAGGGTPTYSYSWSTGLSGTGATGATGLIAANYTVTVTDSKGCTQTSITAISNIPAPTATLTFTPPTCKGGNDGTATVVATGGTVATTYSYSWSTTATGVTGVTGLLATNYGVTVTDDIGCKGISNVTLTEPDAVTGTTTFVDATCGASNGSASVVASGGNGPAFTYSWSPLGGTGQTTVGVPSGMYVVTITDSKGCTGTTSANIGTTTGGTASITTHTDVTCANASNGTAVATMTGGSGTLTYSWAPAGGTGQTITGQPGAIYTVTITDGNGCSSTSSVTIIEPAVVTATSSAVDAICTASNGSVSVTTTGGTGAFVYLWSTSATTQTVSSLPAGIYVVTVTDANGCTASSTATIGTINGSGTATASKQSDVICNGGTTGVVSVSMTGGTAAFSYVWAPSAGTGITESNLGAGSYSVTVTDANGCTATSSVTITEPTALSVTTASTPATCGSSNGSVSATPTGGTGSFTYSWDAGGATGQTVNSLSAGTYTIYITDANGCTATNSAVVNNSGTATVTASVVNNVTCNGGTDGSAIVNISGGTPPFTGSWSPGGATTQTVSSLAAGTYTVTIIDNNLCQSISTVTITEPTAITAITTPTSAACGQSNGGAFVTATGGTGTLTYTWSNGGTTQTITGVAANSYTVTIYDANNCSKTDIVAISNSPAPTIDALTGSPLKCNGGSDGSAVVSASGGTAPLTYSWSNGPSNVTGISGLTAQTYVVSVTDATGCTAISTVAITEPTAINPVGSSVAATCGSANGSASVAPTGGTGSYTYLWDTNEPTQAITNLVAKTYVVTVSDANGCTVSTSVIVTNTGGGIATASVVNNVTCNGGTDGSVTVNINGGTPSFAYLWSVGGATGQTVTGLAQGTYYVTVTDANLCQSISSVTITEPTAITSLTSSTNATCGKSNGSMTVTVNGGVLPYTTIKWSDNSNSSSQFVNNVAAGTYTVTVTDFNGCSKTDVVAVSNIPAPTVNVSSNSLSCNGDSNGSATVTANTLAPPLKYLWNTSDTTTTITNLSAQTYDVLVTDANGCTAASTVTITEPSAINPVPSTINATCTQSNGSATVNVTGGTSPYKYVWALPSTSTSATASNLSAGTYVVTVTDFNGCTKSTSAIVVNTGGPSVITTNSTPVLCNGGNTGSATVTVTSGTTPYTYIWNPGATSTTSSTTDNATTLKADIYTVTIRDANGCDAITTVTVTEPPVLNAPTFSSSNAACGLSNGSAIANASGGTGALVYTWSNSTAGASATGLAAGTYTVTVTDANNCTASSSVTIGNSNGPKAAASVTSNVACNATNTGTATVTITSGSAPFTYSWSTGASSISSSLTDVQDSLSANTYTVTVTDTKGCSSTSTVAFTNPPAMTIKASGKDALCGFNDGTSTATASGGTPVYKFSWNNGDTTDTADNLAPGIYTVTATDSKGCTITITDTINSISSATINVIPAQQTIQQGASVSITVVGGVTYSWSPGEGLTCTTCPNPIATPTVSTIYTVTATDKNGCTATAKINITVRQPCTDEEDVFIANIFSPNGDSKNDMLYVQGNGLTNIYWAIYDRWGNLLFESFKQADGWDGTRKGAAMDSGTYVWYLKGTCLRTNSEVRLKGNTTIVK